jgi:hypothetical protein
MILGLDERLVERGEIEVQFAGVYRKPLASPNENRSRPAGVSTAALFTFFRAAL